MCLLDQWLHQKREELKTADEKIGHPAFAEKALDDPAHSHPALKLGFPCCLVLVFHCSSTNPLL